MLHRTELKPNQLKNAPHQRKALYPLVEWSEYLEIVCLDEFSNLQFIFNRFQLTIILENVDLRKIRSILVE
jgi:hypothetical protein